MRKMGLHDNQIIGKMKMDGIDPKRIQEVRLKTFHIYI